ncbi:hypothetical protein [Pseudomonas aeruginosa]|uniref:hypothetical protein n=1 Tax=Pseudomonas aeruginosa TaxID=287 RepID=UPI0011C3D547|nr:hypothetical protein [Pseudomonas aeruginosa]
MTNANDRDNCPIFQSLITLRDTIDAVSCLSSLIPEDFDRDGMAIGLLFKRLSERLQDDLATSIQAYHLINLSGS